MAELYEADTDKIDIHVQNVSRDIPAFVYITEEALFEKVRQIFEYSLHNETVSRLCSERYVDRILNYHADIFRALIASGEIAKNDPNALAMMYASPVLTLIGVCDRQPEREAECLEKLREHVKLFFQTVHGGVSQRD